MTKKKALAEFGVGVKSERFTPWITLITLSKGFWPWTSKQGILNARLSRLFTPLTVTLQNMSGKQRGEQIRAGAVQCKESIARSWIHWIGVLRSPKDSSPCWDSPEPGRNVLLFSPKCGVGATPWDQQRRYLWGVEVHAH